jgi:hypothetical protein
MSLTQHQKYRSVIWSHINAAIDTPKVEAAVTQINSICNSRQLIKLSDYPEMFNFALTGKAVIYAYVLIYHRDLFSHTLVGRCMADQSSIFKYKDVIAQAICAAIAEDCLRKGQPVAAPELKGINSLNAGEMSGPNKALYDDVSVLAAKFTELDRPAYDPSFNVPPRLASCVGGADAQLTFGPELWSLHTTLKRMPMTVSKLKQQLAYFLLDLDAEGESYHNWQTLCFYFPRHQQFIKLDPWKYINKKAAGELEDALWLDDSDQGYLGSDEYNRDMFFQE